MSDTDITVGDVRYSPDYESKASRKPGEEWHPGPFGSRWRRATEEELAAERAPQPGEVCVCGRRVPFPKTEKTPPTKKKAYWVPADEHEAHEDVLETAAKHLGTFERPFWEFATATLALALVLQDESLRGFAHRNPHSREYEVPDRAEPETRGLT